MSLPDDITITKIESAALTGTRPHVAGCNARMGVHGLEAKDPIVRLHTNTGTVGWGWSRAKAEDVQGLVGRKLNEVFDPVT